MITVCGLALLMEELLVVLVEQLLSRQDTDIAAIRIAVALAMYALLHIRTATR